MRGDVRPARGTRTDVRRHTLRLTLVERADSEGCEILGRVGCHGRSPARCCRSFSIASRMRPLIVPRGAPTRAATSDCDRPPQYAGMFVAYTQGAAATDAAAKQKAVSDLDGYRRDFDAFLSGANPNLPKGAVAQLLTMHVSGIAKSVDQLAAKDYRSAYVTLKGAKTTAR